MDVEEKVTLTQRRALSGADKLDRTKLAGDGPLGGDSSELTVESGKGGSAKIIVWILIIAILAVAAYLGLRTFLNKGTTPEPTPTPTPTLEPTPDPLSKIFMEETLEDTRAVGLQAAAKFITADQAVGEASESAYTVDSILIQPYESFIRVEFVVTSDGDVKFPETTAIYATELKQIKLSMSNVTEDKGELAEGQTVNIPSSFIESVTHDVSVGNKDVYLFTLTGTPKFVLHTLEGTDSNKVVLDIAESDVDVTATPTPSGSVTATPTTTATATVTPTDVGGVHLTNDYSTTDQSITYPATTGNTVKILGYNYGDTPSFFNYNIKLGDGATPWPNVSAKYDTANKKLTVTISNLQHDGIVGNGGSGSTDFAAKGVRDVNKVSISNSNNKSVYVFEFDKALQYKMLITESNKQLRFEFKH